MGDTKAIPIAPGGNNGNGKVRELILWILGFVIPVLMALIGGLWLQASAHGERIKGCEVQAVSMSDDLREMRADIKELLRRVQR